MENIHSVLQCVECVSILAQYDSNRGVKKVTGPDDMKQKIISHLRWMQKTPDRIRSFFHLLTTKNAAL